MAIKNKIKDKLNIWITIILLGLNLFAFNFLIRDWHGARVDLTEYNEHSLSGHTRKVLRKLPDRVEIVGIFSKNTHKLLKPLLPKIQDMLGDYVAESGGRVVVELEDPESDREVKSVFENYGIKPMPMPLASKYKQEVKSIYFNIIIKYGDQTLKYGIDNLIDVKDEGGKVDVSLKNMELLLTRGIKKVTTSFTSLDSVLANITSPVQIIFHQLPEEYKQNIAPEKLKEIQSSTEKLENKIQSLQKRFNNIKYKKVKAKNQEKIFMVEINYGSKKIEFPLFMQTAEVSSSDISERVETSLKRVLPGFTRRLGLIIPPADVNPMMARQMRRRPPSQFAILKQLLQEDFEIEEVDLESGNPPLNIDVLLLARPEEMSEKAVYALDQYIMLGGSVVILLDPGKLDMMALAQSKLKLNAVKSGLEELMANWGVNYKQQILADKKNLPYPMPREIQPGLVVVDDVPYNYFIKYDSGFEHPIVANIPIFSTLWTGAFEINNEKNKNIKIRPVLKSSSKSWLKKIDPESGVDLTPNPAAQESEPPDSRQHLVAVSLEGKFTSLYKGKKSPLEKNESDKQADDKSGDKSNDKAVDKSTDKAENKSDQQNFQGEPKKEVSPETRVLLVADSDFISEIGMKILENKYSLSLKFLRNSLEWVQSSQEDFVTSSKGMPRPLDDMSPKKKSYIQHFIWIISLLALAFIFAILFLTRRRNIQ
ncbi:MAG: Gldg family protein [Deltaproteobacteria bacterium]|jgi:ABC-2 type transport system permease protein|nr:Gldg family protein [Deltaproteobacteria bacterium]